MNQETQIGNALRQANPQDAVSVAVMARELVRSGMKLDEKSLNREILSGLMSKANPDDPQSLKALCKELIEQGYGPKLIAPAPLANDNLIVINPIKINPSKVKCLVADGLSFGNSIAPAITSTGSSVPTLPSMAISTRFKA